MTRPVQVAHVSQIEPPTAKKAAEEGAYVWKPVRHHFGIQAFGVNAMVARKAGDQVVEEHTEVQPGTMEHEELYFVADGHATFQVGDATLDAPAGTFVFVGDPSAVRSARALVDGTTVVAIGGAPGHAYSVAPWEAKYFQD